MPHQIVPAGNLAVLNKTQSNGKGSTETQKVGVVLKAQEQRPGACRPGESTDAFSLRLQMVDGNGIVILDQTRDGLTCDRRVGQETFMVDYGVENCAGSVAPSRNSTNEVVVTATTEDGELVVSRTLRCNR